MANGVDDFIERMTRLGLEPESENDLVIYQIEPVDGALAGTTVATGVAVGELQRWPVVPPHWIHLPESVRFAQTNSRPSTRSGWLMHSRQITRWGQDPDPGVGWASHVRGVVGAAIA